MPASVGYAHAVYASSCRSHLEWGSHDRTELTIRATFVQDWSEGCRQLHWLRRWAASDICAASLGGAPAAERNGAPPSRVLPTQRVDRLLHDRDGVGLQTLPRHLVLDMQGELVDEEARQ